MEWSEVIFSPFSPPFQRGREECLGRVGDFFSAFKMVFLSWHWEEGALVISNKGDGPRLNVFERHLFFIGCNLFSRSILCNFVTQFYFAWPPPCEANEL